MMIERCSSSPEMEGMEWLLVPTLVGALLGMTYWL